MNLERIRERRANGFKPFALELTSGRRIPVFHPDFVAVGRGVVIVLDTEDSVTPIDALHITAIDDLPASRKKK